MKIVIDAFRKKLLVDNVSSNEQITEQFEQFYTSKKSLAAIADVYAKKSCWNETLLHEKIHIDINKVKLNIKLQVNNSLLS